MKRLITFITGLFLFVSINGQILRYSNYVYPPPITGYCAEFDTVYAAFDTEPHDDTAVFMNAMVNSLDSAGLWDRMDLFYVFAAHDSVDSFINWIHPGTYDVVNYDATWDRWQGFTGNGTSAYLDTECNIYADSANLNYSLNNATIAGYFRGNPTQERADIAAYSGTNAQFRLSTRSSGGNIWGYLNCSGSGEVYFATANAQGFALITRRPGNVQEIYKNPTGEGTENTYAPGSLPNATMAILARGSSSPSLFSLQQVSIVFIMDGITTAEAELIYEIIQRYMTAIGSEV